MTRPAPRAEMRLQTGTRAVDILELTLWVDGQLVKHTIEFDPEIIAANAEVAHPNVDMNMFALRMLASAVAQLGYDMGMHGPENPKQLVIEFEPKDEK